MAYYKRKCKQYDSGWEIFRTDGKEWEIYNIDHRYINSSEHSIWTRIYIQPDSIKHFSLIEITNKEAEEMLFIEVL